MLNQIKGLHHVTSFAGDAQKNNAFFTQTMGLRRVKKTVNFDAPDVYHLYYGDEQGTPGSVMTYFPFPHIGAGRPGTGEVGSTVFAVPKGSLGFWKDRFAQHKVAGLEEDESFGAKRLHFIGVDGDGFALVEQDGDARVPYVQGGIGAGEAIRGFHSTSLRLRGDVSEHGALRFFRRTGEGVYDMEDLALRTKAVAEFVAAHKLRTKAPRMIGLGYSNGANILASVMFSSPSLFDDAVLMHPLIPWLPADQPSLAGKRVLITTGKRDPICPAALSARLGTYFEQQKAETKLLWHDGGHELRQTEVDAAKLFLA